ncbi:MAG: biotin synthase BioB [Desulfobulbaceae bacterium]|nr:biotin synthase BioB [Desulfobulbaceae bacterium]
MGLLHDARNILLNGGQINRETALTLAKIPDKAGLYQLADAVRRHFMGNVFDLCSIINAKSGNCSENCRFCAQSARHHTGIESYTIIPEDEALTIAEDNDRHGVKRLSLVTSGRSLSTKTVEELANLYDKMAKSTGLLFCASAGLLDENSVDALHQAGVGRYHCNLEASRNYFPQVCTTHTWEEKVDTLRLAREHGMSLCSGGIIGMGESLEDRIDLALQLRELGVKSIPVNILTPIEGTPLEVLTPLSLDEVLTAVALFRLINPDAVIRMAGGRQQLGADQYRCFNSGANGAIVGNYLTTDGSGIEQDLAQISALGYTFAREPLHA